MFFIFFKLDIKTHKIHLTEYRIMKLVRTLICALLVGTANSFAPVTSRRALLQKSTFDPLVADVGRGGALNLSIPGWSEYDRAR